MNLVAYDTISNIVNTKKSWIDIQKRCLFTKETVCRNYVAFGQRYDQSERYLTLYLILLDNPPTDRPYNRVVVKDNGAMKISIKSLYDLLGLSKYKTTRINVTLAHVEHDDDGDVYEILV